MTLSVGSWNIGGGILGESHQRGATAELGHHIARLAQARPDVLCLQEAHEFHSGQRGQAARIAAGTGVRWQRTWAVSGSHLDPDADLSLAVLSRYPITRTRTVTFPNPGLSATGPRGEHWDMFDKGYLVTEIALPQDGGMTGTTDTSGPTSVTVVDAHCFPFHYFGTTATDPRFTGLWAGFADDLLALARSGPTVVCVDLNHEPVGDVLGALFDGGVYAAAFSDTPTTPQGLQQDHIVHTTADLALVESSVVPTEADHHYCQARFEVRADAQRHMTEGER